MKLYLLQTFHFRYVALNAKLSTAIIDTLTPDIQSYLHNRPHWFVRHCIRRIRNAQDLLPECVTKMTDDLFQVCLDKEIVKWNLFTALH